MFHEVRMRSNDLVLALLEVDLGQYVPCCLAFEYVEDGAVRLELNHNVHLLAFLDVFEALES